ncbi:hypothetical protein H8E77_40550 [bacterium]|nr:hypothetical protein [bacterium]
MKPRERILAALNHQETDRTPIDLGGSHFTTICAGAYENLKNHLVKSNAPVKMLSLSFETVVMDEAVLRHLPVDTRGVFANPPSNWKPTWLNDNTFIDEWGITYHQPPDWIQYDMIAHPLSEATINDLEQHHWPDPLDEGRYAGLKEQAKELKENTDYAVIATTVDSGFFERSWYVCGWERFFTSLAAEPSFAVALMEKICDIQMQRWDRFLQEVGQYADVIAVGDDIAIHNSPVMSPEMYRKIVKPIQAKFYRFLKERTDAKLLYHTCGNVSPLIDDLIEIGVDALNPIQVSAVDMDSKQLNERFGGKICFWGGIDTQRILPFGSPDDVRREVRRRIADLAPGYVLAAVHNIQDDVSPENICAMLDEAKGTS